MRRKMASMLILTGFLFAGWNGYLWLAGTSSGQEAIGKNDIITNAEDEKSDPKTTESLSLPDNRSEPAATTSEEKIPSSPAAKKREEPILRDYAEYEKGAEVGWLLIPGLDMKYPIYWGTDEETLMLGVGYHPGNFTTPPDGLRHTVLSGHRDTVFRGLGELELGARMYVQFENIQYEYEIKKTWITDAEDRSVIVGKTEPTLTLTTCYPFNFIGSAPDRYIVEAALVDTTSMN
ncbi:class D sortase [Metaplanococcus flavidus]|uniref:Class D sortase n=1 Tax=Metaplanococcus flavidus TaxID=569883 RepID=A0ABW3LDP3_9BACL